MEEKQIFALRALDSQENFSQLCKEFGISTKTGYKGKQRVLKDGMRGLVEQSRRPRRHAKQVSKEIVCEIVNIKQTKKT